LLNFCDEALWSQAPAFKLVGVGGIEDEKRAEINAKIIRLQMEKIGFRRKLREFIKNQIVFGFAIAKIPYSFKTKYVVRNEAERLSFLEILKNAMGMPVQKESVPIYDNIDFVPLSPYNVYWDYFAKWDEQEAIIERIDNISNSQLRLMKKANPDRYLDIEKILKDMGEEQMKAEENKSEKMSHTSSLTGLSGEFFVDGRKRHELLECWCNFDIDGDGIDEECVIVVLDRKHLIRLELNPYDLQVKPYLFAKWEDIAEADSLGMGVPQLAERSQAALNDFTNQLMDDITMILDCMIVVDEMANIPTDQLKSRPRGVIRSSAGVNSVGFIRPPDVSTAAIKAIAMIKDDIRESTGASVSMQGLPARYDTTATEARQMGDSAQRDVFTKLRNLEDCIIKEFLRMAYSCNLQFMSTKDVQKIVGVEAFGAYLKAAGKSIDDNYSLRGILEADYDFIPLGITQIENKVIKGQQAMNLYNIAIKSPPGIWNIRELAKLIVKYVAEGDERILADEAQQVLMSPIDENVLMEQGEKPQAKMAENHQEHVQMHEQAILPQGYEQIRREHIKQHLELFQMKIQQEQMRMQQEMMAMTMAAAQNGQKQAAQAGGQGLPPQEQPTFAPKGLTPQQAGQVPGLVHPPASLGGNGGNMAVDAMGGSM
jgi:hypothetical protein